VQGSVERRKGDWLLDDILPFERRREMDGIVGAQPVDLAEPGSASNHGETDIKSNDAAPILVQLPEQEAALHA